MIIEKRCPFCGTVTKVEVSDESYNRYVGGELAQVAFANLSKVEREVIISGLCFKCIEDTFNTPAPGHEEAFGKHLGSCTCCDMAVYEKDIKDGKFCCRSCGNNEFE